MGWAESSLIAYVIVLSLLSVNGAYRLWLVGVWLLRKREPSPPFPADPPRVTVQLPVFNERYVVERVVRAAAALDYPRERLQIQVLDDSTDDTTEIARLLVAELRAAGLDIELVHRTDRTGFKAGALEHGLRTATGELIAIFDADFLPTTDFLRQTVPWFAQPELGVVQTRWGHLNAADSWLTDAQSIMLDGHFVVEQSARSSLGHWFNFNGTAGVWRRAAIEGGGGWQHDTLTEDLDLSYRAQLAGWRFRYLWWVVSPAELPPDMLAFKGQQYRWSRGSVQTARKLLGRIWFSSAALANKLEATAHLGATFSYPLVVLLTLLLPLAVAARAQPGPLIHTLIAFDFLLFPFAILPFVAFFGAAVAGAAQDAARGVAGRLVRTPIVLALGLGMSVAQTRAVIDGLSGTVGTFVRTPKRGAAAQSTYRADTTRLGWLELVFSAYLGVAMVYTAWLGDYGSLPFMLLFVVGYGAVGLSSLRQAHTKSSTAGGQVTNHSHGASDQAPVAGSSVARTP
jgi:cellulose synthase/poly-beta-1,6-N-acetylglucosamine synthase-like glycosyltransferase